MSRVNRPRRQSVGPRLRLEELETREVPAVITVDNPLDVVVANKTNLRQAITAANAAAGADTIDFAAAIFDAGNNLTVTLNAALPAITDALTVDGVVAGKNKPVIKPAAGVNALRIFKVNPPIAAGPINVKFEFLQITGGRAFNPADLHGGGIKSTNANLTLTDCVVFGNQSSADGGGVYVDNAITSTITGTEVRDNTAGWNGGGVAAKNSALVVEKGSAVNNNTAGQGGGGIYVFVNALVVPGGTSLKLDGTANPVTVSGNRANNGDGGGVLVQGGAVLPPVVDVLTTTIADNKAYGTVAVANGEGGEVKTLTSGGRGGGIAVIGAFTVNADAATTVSNNGQQAPAPITPPAKLGVYLDPAVVGTFAATANVTNTNYQIPL